ncbi:MAG TPA: polysaccharide deacetylase family protein [Jiangellaceae bacterium]|nr:polysaccharide deacetylase family protein [Jiangellaceae bacterium]
MRPRTSMLAAALVALVVSGCGAGTEVWPEADIVGPGRTLPPPPATSASASPTAPPDDGNGELGDLQDLDLNQYPATASEWGQSITGVRTRLATEEPVVAITLDACAGPGGLGFDGALIDLLVAEEVPATLFVTRTWIEANEDAFAELASQDQFEIANHGTQCRPLSVTGESAYGITGTSSVAEVVDEVAGGLQAIEERTGAAPVYFRAGTAHYDEVAVRIVQDLGLVPVGSDLLGDGGATFTAAQVSAELERAQPGSIVLLHMNHPESGTVDGVRAALPSLRARGLRFVHLSDHELE